MLIDSPMELAMASDKTSDSTDPDALIKDNFLPALHDLKFTKTNNNAFENLQIERRCLAAKYMGAKKFNNEEMANLLLRKGLETYQQQMDDKTGVNNYWSQIEALKVDGGVDNSSWKSGLTDPKIALKFVKSLNCQIGNNLLDCKNKEFGDREVKEIVNFWRDEDSSMRIRKIPEQRKLRQSTIDCYGNNGPAFGPRNQSVALSRGEYQNHNFPAEPASEDAKDSEHGFGFASSSRNYSPQESPHFGNKLNLKVLNRNTNLNKRQGEGDSETEFQRQNHVPYSKHDAGRNSSQEEEGDERRYKKKNVNTLQNRSAYSRQDTGKNSSQDEDTDEGRYKMNNFRSAKEELQVQQMKRNKSALQKKSLGGKPPVNSQYICPFKRNDEGNEDEGNARGDQETEDCEDERLKNIDPKMIELIKNEIMDSGAPVSWNDIAGLEFAKNTIKEIVVFPLLRPDIFTGLRRPPKGILLFGPPGTGKTLIGKCIASQSKSTFFSISASSLTSKWIGEGEKMVRALFAVARVHQPAVVFIDEIDSLLSQRSETEHESSRRIKTEFLVQLDGAATAEEDRILVIGATNRPQELDEAARRRLVKRLYVPLPEFHARSQIIKNLLRSERHDLTEDQILEIAKLSEGYSGADMTNLCKEASMGPIRSISFDELQNIRENDVRGVTAGDFKNALSYVRSSVSQNDLTTYVAWDQTYGTGTAQKYGS